MTIKIKTSKVNFEFSITSTVMMTIITIVAGIITATIGVHVPLL